MLGDDRYRVTLLKWQFAGGEFVQHHPQCIEIRPPIVLLAQGKLRSHVKDRAFDPALGRHARSHGSRDAKVHEFGIAVGVDQDVFGFEIAMNDAMIVRVLERLANLN